MKKMLHLYYVLNLLKCKRLNRPRGLGGHARARGHEPTCSTDNRVRFFAHSVTSVDYIGIILKVFVFINLSHIFFCFFSMTESYSSHVNRNKLTTVWLCCKTQRINCVLQLKKNVMFKGHYTFPV